MNKQREQLREDLKKIVSYYSEHQISVMDLEDKVLAREHNRKFNDLLSLFDKHYLELIGEGIRDPRLLESEQKLLDDFRNGFRNKVKGDSQNE